MIELAEIVAGWPLSVSFAVAAAAQGLRAGRRRGALNRALHEVRRPLQALAMVGGPALSAPGVVQSSVEMAAAALERLDSEINGGTLRRPAEVVEVRPLVEAATRRWRSRVNLAGGTLSMRWRADSAAVRGDRVELGQALDNLLVNAIEHGGPSISVDVRPRRGGVCIVVADSGRASRPEERREAPAAVLERLSGRRRRGHGLVVVRRVAAEHGGRFALRRSDRGSLAVLELPLCREPPAAIA